MKSLILLLFFYFSAFQSMISVGYVVASITEEEVNTLKNAFSELQNENSKLMSECETLREHNSKLWDEANRLTIELGEMQQYTRIDNIEIAGIPQKQGEDLYEVLEKLARFLEIPFQRDEVSEVHRLPKRQIGHASIIVRFLSRRVRDRWLTAAKGRPCDVQQVFPDLPSGRFYVNQHLTKYKKGLMDMAKKLANEGVYAFAWVRDGKVYVRKSPSSDVIRIKTYEDFERLPNITVTVKPFGGSGQFRNKDFKY